MSKIRSIYGIESDETVWMVQANDNSDHGVGQTFFCDEATALGYAERLPDPPDDILDLRVFQIHRVGLP